MVNKRMGNDKEGERGNRHSRRVSKGFRAEDVAQPIVDYLPHIHKPQVGSTSSTKGKKIGFRKSQAQFRKSSFKKGRKNGF